MKEEGGREVEGGKERGCEREVVGRRMREGMERENYDNGQE